MVDFINRARGLHANLGRLARQAGGGPTDQRQFDTAGLALAVREAGVQRFRPILLTSLTTFFGLAPLMWNTSLDASFMVPMAVSLGFGVLFATFIHADPGADLVHDPGSEAYRKATCIAATISAAMTLPAGTAGCWLS